MRLLTKKKYCKKNGSDSLAVTKGWKRTIDFSPQGRDRETIIHELLHAFRSEMCAREISDPDELEEHFAELVAKRGQELLVLADKLSKMIRQLA